MNAAQKEILDAHNFYRSQVGVPLLHWSDTLRNESKDWAIYLSNHRLFKHSGVKGEGENIWMGSSGHYSFTQMVQSFGSEKKFYNHDVITRNNFQHFGHYTQMVWRYTTHVGAAGLDGPDGNYRLVCRYSPPGNVIGQRAY